MDRIDFGHIDSHTPVALTNARIADVTNGCFCEPGTVVTIRGGSIVDLATPGNGIVRPGVVVDLEGKTVLPGLFNVHCHGQMVNPTVFAGLGTLRAKRRLHAQQVAKNMGDCLERGVTNIRDAFTDDLRMNLQLKERLAKGEIPGPRIQQAVLVGALGGYLTPRLKGLKKVLLGLLGLGKINYADAHSGAIAFAPDADGRTVRDAVDRAIDERGAELIKVGESMEESILNPDPMTMTMNQLEAITDQARKRGVQSTIHSVSQDTFRRAVKAGFSSLAHMARDGELTREDVAACLDAGAIVDPTLSVGYDMSWKLNDDPFADAPHMAAMYAFRNRTFEDLAREFWLPELADHVVAGFNQANAGRYKMLGLIDLTKLLAHFSRMMHFGNRNTRKLLDAGVPAACGNDGGIQACTPAMISHELGCFDLCMNPPGEKTSFDGAAALKTATINSARSMGIDDRFGSIAVGKTADLVVVDGNPFEDPSVIGKRVDALFMDGRLVIDNCRLEARLLSAD